MLLKESHQRLVPALILTPHPVIRQIATRGHEAVDLVAERVHLARHLQGLLERLDGLCTFVLGGKKTHGHSDVGSIGGVDHCRVGFGCGGELAVGTAGVGYNLDIGKTCCKPEGFIARGYNVWQCAYLAAPAHAHNTPLFDLASGLGLDVLDYARNGSNGLRRGSDALEESTKLGALLRRVGGEVGGGKGPAVEEVGDVDLIAGMGEHVSTLGEGISDGNTFSERCLLDVHTWST